MNRNRLLRLRLSSPSVALADLSDSGEIVPDRPSLKNWEKILAENFSRKNLRKKIRGKFCGKNLRKNSADFFFFRVKMKFSKI